jgi:hypothetical protein
MDNMNAPLYVNYQQRVDECRAEFPVLSEYLASRKYEVEVRNPKNSSGIDGLTWDEQVEGYEFWYEVHFKNYTEANAILRYLRPDLYDFDARYHFAASILQNIDADIAEAILYGAVSIDQVIDRINALAQ